MAWLVLGFIVAATGKGAVNRRLGKTTVIRLAANEGQLAARSGRLDRPANQTHATLTI